MIRWVLMILGCMASDAWSANQVVWYPKARTFDLRVKDVPLEVFLGMIKSETGWEAVSYTHLTLPTNREV